jgi:predicted TIM-barrel fold metal-dependent hydrolase
MEVIPKKIDMHTHYVVDQFALRPNMVITNQDMQKQFDANNIVGAIVMYLPKLDGTDKDCFENNKKLKAAIDKDRNRKYIPFAIVNPLDNNPFETAELQERYGFKGIKLIPPAHNYAYDVPSCLKTMENAESLGMPVMLHSGFGVNASLKRIEKLISNFESVPIIVAHMREDDTACPRLGHIELIKRHKNVYLDTSYAVHTDRIKQIEDDGLIGRAFWADDFPYGGANVLWNSRRVSDAPISDESKYKLFFGNADKFIRKYCQ